MYEVEKIMERFARYLRVKPESNLRKFITILSEQLRDIQATNERIKEWRSVDRARGVGLDMIGQIVRQPRGAATDEVYRVLLKAKNAQAFSDGSVNSIIQILSIALDTSPEEFIFEERWNDPVAPRPTAVSLVSLPLWRLNEVGMSPDMLGGLVEVILSVGVELERVELEGTFAFGGIPIEYDPEAGFSTTAGDTGGYLGTAFSPETRLLPI